MPLASSAASPCRGRAASPPHEEHDARTQADRKIAHDALGGAGLASREKTSRSTGRTISEC
ncbi:hypothetical protein PSMK_27010 [Phycisphaera mikurensis NBRC 102666]|uniref:Uncharacterized protein n=2 Tax=Phycisphaera mikurensis (strain NBRC 102666 / KCTC 22515 / FYK2301M01) TaxID=1142394 RepID=I0IHX2_PHYMF|nr:hypothetical protein PSMK_27010 [Phycisphaera mikurensis NBRC 102666]